MNVPLLPLPGYRTVAAFLRHAGDDSPFWTSRGGDARVYSRGAWALAAAAGAAGRGQPATVFIPDYFCNEALGPLRAAGHRLIFYPIDETLQPQWSVLAALAAEQPRPHAIVVVHYFGFPMACREAAARCAAMDATLIEDAAHVLAPAGDVGRQGQFVIYSPHKLLPVPQGGILVAQQAKFASTMPCTRRVALNRATGVWVAKRVIQRFARPLGGWRSTWNAFEIDGVGQSVARDTIPRVAVGLLSAMSARVPDIVERRRANYSALVDAAGDHQLFDALSADTCPYLFPLLFSPDKAPVVHEALNRAGIPARSWPDLPPEVLARPAEHKTAIDLRHRVVTLPVHQDLQPHHVAYMSDTLRRVSRAIDG
jgi:dTDP-4-amino-4,6-dideoxygalactose transaminase